MDGSERMSDDRTNGGTERVEDEQTARAGGDAGAQAEAAAGTDAELWRIQDELEAVNERHLRLAAEFDNFRKRTERERGESWGRAQAELVKRLLDVLDDLQRYAEIEPEQATVESLLEGTRLVEKKFRHSLESAGLEAIAAEGEFFNPSIMEAMMTVPTDKPEEDEMVAAVFQKGYRFKDVLVRPARVQVKQFGG